MPSPTVAGLVWAVVAGIVAGVFDAVAAAAVTAALEAAALELDRGHVAGLWFLRGRARRADGGAGRRVDMTFRAAVDLAQKHH